uniref:Dynactin subunit 1 n=1 Tax=Phallusia mammillata TaxID=59560 RepID=A0A6F9DB87_9ASCI|nr:dynactin subunit 1 [Phallusia mammillata]
MDSPAPKVGSRVEIVGKNLRGEVSYIGSTMFASGKWIGVTLDDGVGKNDGTVQGKRYFTCPPNYGVFVRPGQVQVMENKSTPPQLKHDEGKQQTRSASPTRQSRLQTPSSMQKPRSSQSRLSTGQPQQAPQPVAEVKPQPVVESPPEPAPPQAVEQPVSMSSMSLAPGISLVEIDSLKGQIKEWREKYETIRIKRQDDRAKLKEYEKMKIQNQHLTDTKTRLSEQIQDQAKQLRESKKELQDAVESKERYVEEMSDVHETVEMATLDKEMAEEKADILQKEVEMLNDKVEELQTDLEIIKAEMEDKGEDGAVTSYQVKQLEEQNSRLKEALVRMRDLSSAEKAEYQSLEKQLEKKKKELTEVTQKKDKALERLEVAEVTVDELKEQVDASLAAEEMVESLTDKTLQQEERLMDMEEQIHDLETINEMNEELQENARETELELREEVDLMRAKAREAQRQTEAANEAVGDYQDTIQKFRKLVQELQESNNELRMNQNEQEEKSDAESVQSQPAPFNYQIKMVETKAAARSIDHELRKLEASQANTHSQLLRLFMPATFTRRGGDGDCLLVLLLVERIAKKSQILAKHIGERFNVESDQDGETDLIGSRGDQLTFATDVINNLIRLQVLLERYFEAMGKCSVELFQKIGTLYAEMCPHERVLDFLADQLRKDSLDETTNTEQLQKAIQFFQHLFTVHLSHENYDCNGELEQHLDQSNVCIAAISINTKRIKAYMQPGQETSDVSILAKDMTTSCDDIRQFCKKVKRRMPQPNSTTRLQFDEEVKTRLANSCRELDIVHKCALAWTRMCSRKSGASEAAKFTGKMLQDFLEQSAEKSGDAPNPFDAIRLSLGNVMATMNGLVTSMQEGEYDNKDPRPKIVDPVEKRAQAVKSEMMDSEGLVAKIGDKDVAINELRAALKIKTEEVSESKIRIGMLERKVDKATKEGNEKASLVQQKLDSLTEDIKKKEKEYDDTLDALQNDIDTLEMEKAELKQRLAAQAKKDVFSRLGMTSSGLGSAKPGAAAGIASMLASSGTPVSVTDSPLMTQQIRTLQAALRAKSIECSRLTGEKMVKELKMLSPLRAIGDQKTKMSDERVQLRQEVRQLTGTLQQLAIPSVIDISKRKPGLYPTGSASPQAKLAQQKWESKVAQEKLNDLESKARQLFASERKSQVEGQFASFPSPQFVQSLATGGARHIGSLSLKSTASSGGRNDDGPQVFLDSTRFRQIHDLALRMST